ncbi:hypothetical protein ACF0H5_021994 [Mactra antiquata]
MATGSDKNQRRTRAGSKSSATSKDLCTICSVVIGNDTLALNCDHCKLWVCLNCSKMPKSSYQELVKCDKSFSMDWLCKVCKSNKSDLRSISCTLSDLKSSCDSRLTQVENRLTNLETTMKDTVRSETETMKSELAESVNQIVETRLKKWMTEKIVLQTLFSSK